VVFDQLGNLYGTTVYGGIGKQNRFHTTGGTLYELSPNPMGWTEKVLVNFPNWGFNSAHLGPASVDSLSNVYTTFTLLNDGYAAIDGVVVRVDPKGTTHIFDFNGANGMSPLTGVILDAKGHLAYGTTDGSNFGTFCGNVFQINGSAQESVLYKFCQYSGDGSLPRALRRLLRDSLRHDAIRGDL